VGLPKCAIALVRASLQGSDRVSSGVRLTPSSVPERDRIGERSLIKRPGLAGARITATYERFVNGEPIDIGALTQLNNTLKGLACLEPSPSSARRASSSAWLTFL
jgi:hypothetical protein